MKCRPRNSRPNIDATSDPEYPVCLTCGHYQNVDEVSECECEGVGCTCRDRQWLLP